MIEQLKAIGAGRTPDGFVMELGIEDMIHSRVWIEEKLYPLAATFSYSLRFEWSSNFVNNELEVIKSFEEHQFENLYKCIEDFKSFARSYLC